MLYRNNGESDKADAAHKRLVEIQKKYLNNGTIFC